MRVLITTVGVAIAFAHHVIFVGLVLQAISADTVGDTFPQWKSALAFVLGLPLMPLCWLGHWQVSAELALAAVNSCVWAFSISFAMWVWYSRRARRKGLTSR